MSKNKEIIDSLSLQERKALLKDLQASLSNSEGKAGADPDVVSFAKKQSEQSKKPINDGKN